MVGSSQSINGGDLIYIAGITRRNLRNIALMYLGIALCLLALSFIAFRNEFRNPGTALTSLVLPLAVLWAVPSVFVVPLLMTGRKRGILALYGDHMERKARGEVTTFTYQEIVDADFSGVITQNITSQARPSTAGMGNTRQIAVFGFSLGGLRYRFTSNTRTRQGGSLRDFVMEKVLPERGDEGDS